MTLGPGESGSTCSGIVRRQCGCVGVQAEERMPKGDGSVECDSLGEGVVPWGQASVVWGEAVPDSPVRMEVPAWVRFLAGCVGALRL